MSLFIVDTVGDADLAHAKHVSAAHLGPKIEKVKGKGQPEKRIDDDDSENEYNNRQNRKEELESDEEDISKAELHAPELGLFRLPDKSVDISSIIQEALQKTQVQPTPAELEMDKYRDRLRIAMEKRFRRQPKKKLKSYVDLDHTEDPKIEMTMTNGKAVNDVDLIKTDVNSVLAKSKINVALEQQKSLPILSKRQQQQQNRIERSKTKGSDWFNMPAPEVTEEVKNDLKILQMRAALDPKRFYKKNDLKVLPKYFQMGVVQHSPLDYYNERDNRRNKKRSLVDELLEDTEAQTYTKRKYQEIMAKKNKYNYRKAIKKMKKTKKH